MLILAFRDLFHSSDKVIFTFHVNTIDDFFFQSAASPGHLLSSKMLCMLETWIFKNVDRLTLFESCATKSAGSLESQMC